MKNALLAVPLLAAGVFVAGCASSASSSSSTPVTGATPTTASSAPGGTGTGSTGTPTGGNSVPATGSGGATTASTAACTSADLKVSLGGGAGAGMSQDHVGLQFTNVGSAPCTLSGYPGVSWVAGSDGHQVGAAATRQADITGSALQAVTLAPGALASAPLDLVDAAVFTKSQCKPVPVRGLRVYPPNETAALFLPLPTAAGGYGECSGTTPESSLTIGYVQPGPQPTS